MLTEEFFDILDENGKATGQVCPRSLAHRYGYFHATAHVWVVTTTGDILLQKRATTKDTHPGLWDISCAGHLIAGDTSLDAAVRELREELGLSVDWSALRLLFSSFQSYSSPDSTILDNEFSDVYLLAINPDQVLRFDPLEIDEIKFVSLELFKQMVDSTDPQLVPNNEEYRKVISVISG